MKRFFTWMALALFFMVGCRVSDVRDMEVRVPEMTRDEDVQKVRAALAQLGGVDHEKTEYDAASRTVRVWYDSMVVAHKNIEIAIAEAGYDANGIKAIPPAPAR
ncbi:MAG: heavy-metal-associated domain-containing protein [Kiritimatiellia bacterium]|jgi:copper chaperone CopZ|nr:heavy-metal-associated domain-containing protein [Kiritimatiellia bacterium]MDD4173682.1 heavy-metal-associated domain-containing protein [Kiritimatiellia bacterium]MDD4442044.1 heavy-metal-associated domain-containing protein [Kiritimatiellia bacterium]NLC80951.1 heavy-metal-associated domain-containing protein [Lentisphaerota bacterium]